MEVINSLGQILVAQSGGGGGNTVTLYATGNTTQSSTGTQNLSSILFNGAGNVSVGVTGGSVVISGGTAAASPVNISAGTTSNNLGTVVFSDSNRVSFGLNGSTVTAKHALNFSGGTTSNNISDQLIFSNSNNVSFGLNGSTLTATATVASTQGSINLSAGTTSNLASAFTFSNSNGLAFGLNGSTLTGSYTVPTITNSSWTVSDNATSGTVARLAFTNLNGVTLSLSSGAGGSHTIVGSHNALTSQSNQNVTAANGGFAFQTLSFSNLNGVSFGTSAGSAITASHNAITSQSNQQMTLFATSNTTQSSSGTTNASSLIFAGAGVASVGVTNGSVVVSVPAGGGGLTNINVSAGTTSNDLSNMVFSNSNGVSFGLNGSTVTATVAGPPTLSFYQNLEPGNTLNSQPANALLYLTPMAYHDVFPGNMSVSTVLMNFTGTVSTGAAFTRSLSLGFYTVVNSTQLSLAFSASTSWGTNGANANINNSMAGYRWVTFNSSQFNNAPNFSQTQYWIAHWNRSSGGSQTFSMFGNATFLNSSTRSGTMAAGSSTNTTLKWYPFLGGYSVSFSTAMPNALNASDIPFNAAPAIFVPHIVLNNLGSIIV